VLACDRPGRRDRPAWPGVGERSPG